MNTNMNLMAKMFKAHFDLHFLYKLAEFIEINLYAPILHSTVTGNRNNLFAWLHFFSFVAVLLM